MNKKSSDKIVQKMVDELKNTEEHLTPVLIDKFLQELSSVGVEVDKEEAAKFLKTQFKMQKCIGKAFSVIFIIMGFIILFVFPPVGLFFLFIGIYMYFTINKAFKIIKIKEENFSQSNSYESNPYECFEDSIKKFSSRK